MPGLSVETVSSIGRSLKQKCVWIDIDFKDSNSRLPYWKDGVLRLSRNFNVDPIALKGIIGRNNDIICIKDFHGFGSFPYRSDWEYYKPMNCDRSYAGNVLPCLDLREDLMKQHVLPAGRNFTAITLRLESHAIALMKHKGKINVRQLEWEICQNTIIWIIYQISLMLSPNKVLIFHDIKRSTSFKDLIRRAPMYDGTKLLTQLEKIPRVAFATCPENDSTTTPCPLLHLALASQASSIVGVGRSKYHAEMRANVRARNNTELFLGDVCSGETGHELPRSINGSFYQNEVDRFCAFAVPILNPTGYPKDLDQIKRLCQTFFPDFAVQSYWG